ncbi:MAG TPA: hypothetical protein VJY35_03910 [Candidatus Eisenbacteria bacterium]|nr:hypothetical protein [Candidatus Eisenbacteria bacterium]
MAAKKTRAKAGKSVTRAKATRKIATRSPRKSPKINMSNIPGGEIGGNTPIQVF